MALVIAGTITIWRIVELFLNIFPLSFDEAQYWSWSKALDFGYYSKPPMISWIIYLTTIFGDTEPFIRISSPIAHFITAMSLFFSGNLLFHNKSGEKIGLWACVIWITLPGVSFSAMLISTDPFLLMFWSLALHALCKSLQTNHWKWWSILGLWLGLGLLSKYAMVYFIGCTFIALDITTEFRNYLKKPGIYISIIICFLIYSPNLWWNIANNMSSYRHTSENAHLSGSLFHPESFLEFFASQFGVLGPLLFGALLAAFFWRIRILGSVKEVRLLLVFSVPVLVIMSVQAFLSRANANWGVTAYPASILLLVSWLLQNKKTKFILSASIIMNLLTMIILYNISYNGTLFGYSLPQNLDIFKRVRNWDDIGSFVKKIKLENPSLTPLFDERKVMAPLLYYARPFIWDGVMWNQNKNVGNHYELVTSMKGKEGNDFMYITKRKTNELAQFFESTDIISIYSAYSEKNDPFEIRIYRLNNFKGYNQP